MTKFLLKFFLIAFALVVMGIYFLGKAGAVNDLGGSCNDDGDCIEGLLCSERGTCLGCETVDDCDPGESCDGVCVRSGGNLIGDFCGENAQCASNNCGRSRRCLPPIGTTDEGRDSGPGGEDDWLGIDITIQDVEAIITGLACWLLRVIFAIMVIFLVFAGLRFMNARGEPAKLTEAKKNFTHVLIGIIVIMAVYVIIATVATAVGRQDFSLIPLVC